MTQEEARARQTLEHLGRLAVRERLSKQAPRRVPVGGGQRLVGASTQLASCRHRVRASVSQTGAAAQGQTIPRAHPAGTVFLDLIGYPLR